MAVTLSGAQSLGYLAFDLAYDRSRLMLLDAAPAEFGHGVLFVLNPAFYPSDSGLVRFAWVKAAGFSGDGVVFNLRFRASEDAAGQRMPLVFQMAEAGDVALADVAVNAQDGLVSVARLLYLPLQNKGE